MKIFTSTGVYVQKNDLAYLNNSSLTIQSSVFRKMMPEITGIVNDSNRYDFVKFETEADIEYFKNIAWIIDYDTVKDMNEGELSSYAIEIAEEQDKLVDRFNSMSPDVKKSHYYLIEENNFYDFKFNSIVSFIQYRRGIIKYKLPDELYPKEPTSTNKRSRFSN